MKQSRKLPSDYALDALSIEAANRGKQMGRADYSYGKLVADTTQEERERIADSYRANFKRRRSSTQSFFEEADLEGAGE